ncbi:restriction endonuclease subunit S [Vibrio gazogenes]|uniref:Type I restriction enzyme, S subunit n=1 Tax=Vibrio gazogenes DSM 21264 = NBRC 103151 TaxID=1123492 RepID=A0A1M5GS21_VIBGA|nr:restriction endonuclease subunit S [Vibrio gazogenes]USP13766.1 restriction endonuclease subunit S [Vibrio gazogenes]SHG06471.1 type I restriction enzyme, S subunit [Vibrio gazogenes DSM 21264] [Vibrio gazogenes DSM 21264 = NBRC 103151]SJN58962.1 Type-1 restriction enzyme EcoKI specificity protein [Vibrio gazogenes]
MVPSGWDVKPLADIAQVTFGGTPSRKKPEYWLNGTVPWIRTTEVQNCVLTPEDTQEYISELGLKNSSAKIVPAGTVLLAMIGQGKTRGQVALLKFEATTNQNCSAIIFKNDQEPTFHFNFLLSQYENIRAMSNSAGQSNLSGTLVKAIRVPVPPLTEQKKIAQILSTWDKAISTTEQLLANSQQQKKALMQQLLTGKKRLGMPANSYDFKKTRYGIIPKDWEYPAIKDVCTQVTEKNTEAADYPVLSCSKYDGFVDSLKYFKKKVYSDDTSDYRLIHRGCFGFPSNHVEEGSIGLQNLYDTGIVSPIYVVFRAKTKEVDNTYLYAVLKTDHYRQIFGAATNASVDRRGSLRWKEFSLIHVPLPALEEQQKIAAVLSTADQEITILQQKLDALKQEKKALMQQLLTGKRRVKVEEVA